MKNLIKKIAVAIAISLAAVSTFAQKATDDFTGTWKTENSKNVIITKTANGFIGEGIQGNKKATVLCDVKFSNEKWTATLFRPKDGLKANCELLLDGDVLNIIAHKGLVSKKITWTKQ